jgi:hypothetical protein
MTATTSKLGADTMDQAQFNEWLTELAEPFWLKDSMKQGEFFDVNGFAHALLARQPAAIGKEAECNCASNPHAEGCPVTAHVRAMFAASGESAYGAAPLDKEASKPAAPSVEQDERGAVIATVRTDPPITGVTTGPWTRLFVADVEIDRSGDPTELVKKAEQINHSYAHQSRAASTSANVAQGAEAVVADLSMLVRQLVHSLRKAAPDNALSDRAVDYLKRKGLAGSPLREAAPPAQTALTDDRISEIIDEFDDCSWIDGELRIDCKDMMRLARALLAAAQSASGDK